MANKLANALPTPRMDLFNFVRNRCMCTERGRGRSGIDMVFADVLIHPTIRPDDSVCFLRLANKFFKSMGISILDGEQYSYTFFAGILGDPNMALRIMALGVHYGWWTIQYPEDIIKQMAKDDDRRPVEAEAGLLSVMAVDHVNFDAILEEHDDPDAG